MTTTAYRHEVERVTCQQCNHFLGVITTDGLGPIMDECCGDEKDKCPMFAKLGRYQPKLVVMGGVEVEREKVLT